MHRDQFPPELREFYFNFDWDNHKVWSLDVPVEAIPIAEIEWHLGLPFWSTVPGQPLFDLVPNVALSRLDAYPSHRDKIWAADLNFPIDIMWSEDRFVILDGVHRLAKLKILGDEQAHVRKIPRAMVPRIQREES